MNRGEAPILERGTPRNRARALRRKVILVALGGLAGSASAPSRAVAQADYSGYSGPAVVPPAEAYLGETDGRPEPKLPRWHTDPTGPRTLWVLFPSPPRERPDFWDEAANAMDAWNDVHGIPLVFRRTESERAADVEFRWVRRFETSQAGTTDWETDGEGWLSSVVVTLALLHEDGTPMSSEFLRLVALHELGHAIGLPHSGDPADVMHPGNRNLRLSDRDVRSARRLYENLDSQKVSAP